MRLIQSKTAECHQPLQRIALRLDELDRKHRVQAFGRLAQNDLIGADQDFVPWADPRNARAPAIDAQRGIAELLDEEALGTLAERCRSELDPDVGKRYLVVGAAAESDGLCGHGLGYPHHRDAAPDEEDNLSPHLQNYANDLARPRSFHQR